MTAVTDSCIPELEGEFSSHVDSIFTFINPDEPGCVLGIVKNGELVFGRGYGLASLEWQTPITPEVVFDIASTAKQFTAAAMILLEIDGVLSLDDDIRTWLPEMPDYGHEITIRHLLNHTSGIRDYMDLLTLVGKPYTDLLEEDDAVSLITRQKALNFEPGTKYSYSNSGYLLAAAIVRRAAGKSLREFCDERIFSPLGMEHTSFWDDHQEVIPLRASAYTRRDERWIVSHELNNEVMGDGNLYTTVNDLARWDRNFYQPRIGGSGLLDQLQTRGVLINGDTLDYAAGLKLGEYRGLRTVRHGGASGGFKSEFLRFPDVGTTIICLCNRDDVSTSYLGQQVADLFLADRFFTTSPRQHEDSGDTLAEEDDGLFRTEYIPTNHVLESWIGTYRRGGPASYLRVELIDNQLSLKMYGMTLPLTLYSAVTGVTEDFGVSVDLILQTDEAPPEIVVNNGRPRQRIDIPTLTEDLLDQYIGSYTSSELDVDYRITGEDGLLFLHIPSFEPVEMHAGDDDEFFFLDWILDFRREPDGRVAGFSVDTQRVSGIEFVRLDGNRSN